MLVNKFAYAVDFVFALCYNLVKVTGVVYA